jgi:hypothetical protein
MQTENGISDHINYQNEGIFSTAGSSGATSPAQTSCGGAGRNLCYLGLFQSTAIIIRRNDLKVASVRRVPAVLPCFQKVFLPYPLQAPKDVLFDVPVVPFDLGYDALDQPSL